MGTAGAIGLDWTTLSVADLGSCPRATAPAALLPETWQHAKINGWEIFSSGLASVRS